MMRCIFREERVFASGTADARGRLRFAGGSFAHGDEHVQRVA